ncbi:hypothetical protein [Maridesulfovibrio sp.]|uniref:hypothetical protein n=1 Tax=unclassified Maridesulfovibrio TaxID=2794999 RepID=UPI003B002076
MFIDTNILINWHRGTYSFEEEAKISSVVASEFLSMYDRNSLTSNRYYLPVISIKMHPDLGRIGRKGTSKFPLFKNQADGVVVSLGEEYESYIEYCSMGISKAINEKNLGVFKKATEHLGKHERRNLRRAFEFLLDMNVSCYPLVPSILDMGLTVLNNVPFNPKENVRNSLNDILIFSTALDHEERLGVNADFVTDDNYLNSVCKQFEEYRVESIDNMAVYDFSSKAGGIKKINKESKGYINRNWSFEFKRN